MAEIRSRLALLSQNLRYRAHVFPLPARSLVSWAEGLGLARGGKTILYTGHLYQLLPYLRVLREREQGLVRGKDWLSRLAPVLNPWINVSRLAILGREERRLQEYYTGVLRGVVKLLRKCGVEPGYLYEKEYYPGTLAYDLGLEGVFELQARRVVRAFREAGVRTIITVDPHSTALLREVYPQLFPDWDFEVRSYLEILFHQSRHLPLRGEEGVYLWHDSCVYVRYLGVVEEPREILKRAGLEIREPRFSREITRCCGGPAETLFPEKAGELARARMEELSTLGPGTVITLCPICHFNLRAVSGPDQRVEDFVRVLRLEE